MTGLYILDNSHNAVVHGLGWALIHSLWQGVLIAALLSLILRSRRSGSPQGRYLWACSALFGFVLLVVGTGCYYVSSYSYASAASPIVTVDLPVHVGSALMTDPSAVEGAALPASAVASRAATADPALIDRLLPWLVLTWAIGFVCLTCRMCVGWFAVQRLCRHGTSPIAGNLKSRVDAMCERICVRRVVRVVESGLAATPMVIGCLRPIILLPTATVVGLTPSQLQAVLAHELAHVRRHDYLVNLAQCLVETLLFYHPAVWWISRTIRAERERCCDDIAVGVCGNRVDYARALLRIAETAPPYPGRLSPASQGGDLSGRIRRLLGQEPHATRTRNAAGLWTALASLCVVTALVMSAHAGGDSAEPAEDSTSTNVSVTAGDPESDSPNPSSKRIIEIPYHKLKAGYPEYNIVIRPGDVIKVSDPAPKQYIYLNGLVKRPGAYTQRTTNDLTLKQLIVSAGGVPKGKPVFIKLVRRVKPDQTETLHFSYDDLMEGWIQDAFLAPNDLLLLSHEPGPEDEAAKERRRLREQLEPLRAKLVELSVQKEEARIEHGEGHRLAQAITDKIHPLQQQLVEILTLLKVDPALIDTTILPTPEPPSIPNATPPRPSDLEVGPALSHMAKPGDRVSVVASNTGSKPEHTSFTRVLDAQGRLSLPGIPLVDCVDRPIEDIKKEILRKMQSHPGYKQTEIVIIDLPDYLTYTALGTTVARPGQHTLPHTGFRLIEALAQIGGLPEDTQTVLVIRQEPQVNGDLIR